MVSIDVKDRTAFLCCQHGEDNECWLTGIGTLTSERRWKDTSPPPGPGQGAGINSVFGKLGLNVGKQFVNKPIMDHFWYLGIDVSNSKCGTATRLEL